MDELKHLFANNEAWAKQIKKENPDFFKNLSLEQRPKYLWIGCSDSRIPAEEILGLKPGEVFVHRNVANLCPKNDSSSLSVLQFGIEVLSIEHVIVCGHYRCGGISAVIDGTHLDLVDNWLDPLRKVYEIEKGKLDAISDKELRSEKLTDLNVLHQVNHLANCSVIQSAWKLGKKFTIHGWVYDVKSGLLKDLDCSVSSTE
jgi:carbonic anhydrase